MFLDCGNTNTIKLMKINLKRIKLLLKRMDVNPLKLAFDASEVIFGWYGEGDNSIGRMEVLTEIRLYFSQDFFIHKWTQIRNTNFHKY
jgi:hypothetical protein